MAENQYNDFSIFVGDLGLEIDDTYLMQFFQAYYGSVRSAKVILDTATGRSKGYGFVRFGIEHERDRALSEMSGVYVGSRAIRCSLATAKRPQAPGGGDAGGGGGGGGGGGAPAAPSSYQAGVDDPNNTTLFVGGLSSAVGEEQLRQAFLRFGELVYTKIPPGKGCGFVQFQERRSAEYALQEMNGATIGNSSVRISWGRSSKPAPAHGASGGAGQQQQQHASATYASVPSYPTYAGGAAAYGGAAGAGAAAYGAYDPYSGAYGAYGADPYAMAGYGYTGMDAYGYPQYSHAGYAGAYAAAGAQGPGGSSTTQSAGTPTMFDPLTAVSVDKLNSAYMHRQLPLLTGSFLKTRM